MAGRGSLERLGHWFFYVALRLCGQRGGYLLLYPVIFSYLLFARGIKHRTAPYLTRRFPGHSPLRLFVHRLRNILSFGRVLVDRGWMGVNPKADIQGQLLGSEQLLRLVKEGKGIILVTAHMGNWQSALSTLNFIPVKVHALMQYDREAAAKHYFDLGKRKKTFEIIDADGPFGGMIEATAALQRGEVVTIMADRYVKGTSSVVDFLGSPARLPNAAYLLAAHVKAPVAVLLAAKTSPRQFHLKVWDIFYPRFETRENRQEILDDCCRKFGRCLEKYLTLYPYQWYNFFDFWQDDANQKNTLQERQ